VVLAQADLEEDQQHDCSEPERDQRERNDFPSRSSEEDAADCTGDHDCRG
jgi:hypothetical protein